MRRICSPQRKVERQVEELIKHLAVFFLFPSKKFLPISFKIQMSGNFSPNSERIKTKAARCLFFLMSFLFLYILNSLQYSLTVYILPRLVKETAEIETGMTEKSSWDQANIRQKLGLVWKSRKKISHIIKDYFYCSSSYLFYDAHCSCTVSSTR